MTRRPPGREGVRLYRRRPALKFVDIVAPEPGGIETVRQPPAIDLAAIIFTKSGREED